MYSRKAVELNPGEPKYQYSLAFYLLRDEIKQEAINILEKLINSNPEYPDSWFLLGSIYETDDVEKAKAIYQKASENEYLEQEVKQAINQKLAELNKQ